MFDHPGDLGGGVALAEGESGQRHSQQLGRVPEQVPDLGDDALRGSSDEPGIASGDDLRAFGLFAQHKKRSAERGGFFLNPARVAEHQVGVTHPPHDLALGAWPDQRYSAN